MCIRDSPQTGHFPARAKRVIYLFMAGGPSQLELFDYKPKLQQMDGKVIPSSYVENKRFAFIKKDAKLLGTRRQFLRWGDSGQQISSLLPHLGSIADDVAIVRTVKTEVFNHGPAKLFMNTGFNRFGRPSMGSWVTYGLGSPSGNLPGFVVMLDPRGGPISGAKNWTSGYMPAAYQGTVLRSSGNPILDLASRSVRTNKMQGERIDAINALNGMHIRSRQGYSELAARIASYDLAYQLQSTAPEALDVSSESEKTKAMYGLYDKKVDHSIAISPAHFGRQCLVARRLIERGVRFVQLYSGGGHQQQNWDAHNGVDENLKIHCPEVDKPIAGLLDDLEQRGMLEETLVVWGGEFGRQPVFQGKNGGRDHNPKGFTYWMAGAGVKAGTDYGETDELGYFVARDKVGVHDLQATVLHLLGFDPHRLSFRYQGLNQRLIGPEGDGHVIQPVVA